MSAISFSQKEDLPITHRMRRGLVIWKKIRGETRFLTFAKWEEEWMHYFIAGYRDSHSWVPIRWVEKEKTTPFLQRLINMFQKLSTGLR